MKLTYFGHACFTVESCGFTVAIDPYDNNVEGYEPLHIKADKTYCSHGHFDHNYTAAVEPAGSSACDPFAVTEIEIPHDDAGGSKRGMNTIRIFESEGLKLIHFGDIGCMPNEEHLEMLKDADVVLVPVGGVFTIDANGAKQLMDKIAPKTVIPMHYRKGNVGIPVLASPEVFVELCEMAEYDVKLMEFGETAEFTGILPG